ncbi:MAG: type II toxin-antitoxin system HicA family toxin [Xanthomonadales bacterium]|nr:type II toxin-antitoxin system HicA family toxin [Xanthomonadales bacterium]
MPKLPKLSGAQACAILARHGFAAVRQRGSHVVMQNSLGEGGTVTVPVPQHNELANGTLMSIIRQSGLSKHLFH